MKLSTDELFAEPGELKDFLDFRYESRRAGIA